MALLCLTLASGVRLRSMSCWYWITSDILSTESSTHPHTESHLNNTIRKKFNQWKGIESVSQSEVSQFNHLNQPSQTIHIQVKVCPALSPVLSTSGPHLTRCDVYYGRWCSLRCSDSPGWEPSRNWSSPADSLHWVKSLYSGKKLISSIENCFFLINDLYSKTISF